MDVLIDAAALARRRQTQYPLKLLELAIEGALGFPVSIRGLQLWASPAVFDPEHVPERFLQPSPALAAVTGPAGPLRILDAPTRSVAPQGTFWNPAARTYHRRKPPP